MNARTIATVLRRRRQLRGHERWATSQLQRHQARALAAVRKHAVARSPFYAELHRGLEGAPLHALPVVPLATLMNRFDDVVTDRDVRLADVRAFLATSNGRLYRDRYSVTVAQDGAVFLADGDEWTATIASYARAQEWAGIAPTVTREVRMASIDVDGPWQEHAHRLDPAAPLEEIVAKLDALQPECLIARAPMLQRLAVEQLAGRLRMHPQAVIATGERLSDETRRRAQAAWGRIPFDTFTSSVPTALASDCRRHRKHVYEDLFLVEVVDERLRPVPAGTAGAVLVTALFAHTQPLIRVQLDDDVAIAPDRCDCGIPFRLLEVFPAARVARPVHVGIP